MKRFYCTVCRKVKRVQKLPKSIEVGWTTDVVANRKGVCNWHNDPEYFTRARKVRVTHIPVASVKAAGGKRGR